MSELVHLDVADGLATLTLDSPHNRNALSRQLVSELFDGLGRAEQDDGVKVVLLRSADRVFCSGADLSEASADGMVEGARTIVELQRRIVASPKPVVVRLDGPVRAGGIGIVAAADIVVAAPEATFALTEVRLGLAAATISIPLRARLSPRAASDWFLTGRSVGAVEARQHGLVTHVASADQMDAVLATVLGDLRAAARQGLVEAKRLLTADLVADFDARGEEMARLSGMLFHSDVARERMAAALRR
jgi:enoyl-CoA hydratase/carnithine racemase